MNNHSGGSLHLTRRKLMLDDIRKLGKLNKLQNSSLLSFQVFLFSMFKLTSHGLDLIFASPVEKGPQNR